MDAWTIIGYAAPAMGAGLLFLRIAAAGVHQCEREMQELDRHERLLLDRAREKADRLKAAREKQAKAAAERAMQPPDLIDDPANQNPGDEKRPVD